MHKCLQENRETVRGQEDPLVLCDLLRACMAEDGNPASAREAIRALEYRATATYCENHKVLLCLKDPDTSRRVNLMAKGQRANPSGKWELAVCNQE